MGSFDLKGCLSNCPKVLQTYSHLARDTSTKAAFNVIDSHSLDTFGPRNEYAAISSWPESKPFPHG